jgi:Flp pilus assembly pilin Flp
MLLSIYDWLMSFLRKEEGQTLSEYGLILVLVSIAVIVVLGLLGGQLVVVFNAIIAALTF